MIKIIIIVIALILGAIVAGALLYALIVFHHEHRWAKIKSDKYEQYNNNEEMPRL